MPQPSKQDQAKAEAEANVEQADAAAGVDPAEVEGSDPSVAEAIREARSLERQRGELLGRIADNRDFLRLMDRREKLTEEQGEWLDAFYPLKEKDSQRTAEEIKRTKELRAAARKG